MTLRLGNSFPPGTYCRSTPSLRPMAASIRLRSAARERPSWSSTKAPSLTSAEAEPTKRSAVSAEMMRRTERSSSSWGGGHHLPDRRRSLHPLAAEPQPEAPPAAARETRRRRTRYPRTCGLCGASSLPSPPGRRTEARSSTPPTTARSETDSGSWAPTGPISATWRPVASRNGSGATGSSSTVHYRIPSSRGQVCVVHPDGSELARFPLGCEAIFTEFAAVTRAICRRSLRGKLSLFDNGNGEATSPAEMEVRAVGEDELESPSDAGESLGELRLV
jgi:hypothetical protein